ncbi:hypothetical protein BV898_01975 [Hypsibius exemplaris]|uniref:Uncharacterized protein n=1 Tax=Hypsibius exemplaris TaxID=2072580 RepID=A0A1W0X9E3_HYPEX|nr:hypothetical protein BV898_01975 [Hypsibius exemplaris]
MKAHLKSHLDRRCSSSRGWDQTGSNGANLSFPEEFGIITTSTRDTFLVGWSTLHHTSPLPSCKMNLNFLKGRLHRTCSCLRRCRGCWISDPLNFHFGRRGTIFFSAIFCLVSVIGAAFTRNWYELFVTRVILGIGAQCTIQQGSVENSTTSADLFAHVLHFGEAPRQNYATPCCDMIARQRPRDGMTAELKDAFEAQNYLARTAIRHTTESSAIWLVMYKLFNRDRYDADEDHAESHQRTSQDNRARDLVTTRTRRSRRISRIHYVTKPVELKGPLRQVPVVSLSNNDRRFKQMISRCVFESFLTSNHARRNTVRVCRRQAEKGQQDVSSRGTGKAAAGPRHDPVPFLPRSKDVLSGTTSSILAKRTALQRLPLRSNSRIDLSVMFSATGFWPIGDLQSDVSFRSLQTTGLTSLRTYVCRTASSLKASGVESFWISSASLLLDSQLATVIVCCFPEFLFDPKKTHNGRQLTLQRISVPRPERSDSTASPQRRSRARAGQQHFCRLGRSLRASKTHSHASTYHILIPLCSSTSSAMWTLGNRLQATKIPDKICGEPY